VTKDASQASDFYADRRRRTVDGLALIGFLIGFLGSAPFAWPRFSAHWIAGDISGSVMVFIITIMVSGVVLGLLGMAAGQLSANVWNRRHAEHRSYESDAPVEKGAVPREGAVIVVREGALDAKAYASLLVRCQEAPVATARLQSALARTTNLSLVVDEQLVGVARILSDGARVALIAELLVDPEFSWARARLKMAARQWMDAEGGRG
jgi:hypothetical protein